MAAFDKTLRRWQLRALDRVDGTRLTRASERRAVEQFRRMARAVPAYASILREHGVSPARIRTVADFKAECPVIDKRAVFGPFPIDRLCVGGKLGRLAGVLTSSGQGGHFGFGLSTHRQARRAAKAIELAMEYAFQTDRRSTLLVNALPMGVRFSCSTVTVAETSVREDMVTALVGQFAPHHDQTILVTDPLFCKRILDHGRDCGLDWGRFRIHVILGEEIFGEDFRHYVASRLGQDAEGWTAGLVGSSMGVGELGLNLFFETRDTVRLRQLAHRHPEWLRSAIGQWPGQVPPLLFVYDPLRIFAEVVDPDPSGFGALVLSTLDPSLMLPLLRYRTGDRARMVDSARVADALARAGRADLQVPALPMIALSGREQDVLPDGRTLLDIKDALYRDPVLADQLSGLFRIRPEGPTLRLDLQMREGWAGSETAFAERIKNCLPTPGHTADERVKAWRHAEFPFGKAPDYERKHRYCTQTRES